MPGTKPCDCSIVLVSVERFAMGRFLKLGECTCLEGGGCAFFPDNGPDRPYGASVLVQIQASLAAGNVLQLQSDLHQ